MSERSELGQNPIPGGSPAGEPLSGDDEFDALRAEVSRDPILGVPIDWRVVTDLSQKLLAERSKDFAVACYLAVGLVQTDGLKGLHDGLRIVSDLVTNFWDTGYPPAPKRLRGRVNALGFLSEKGGPMLAQIEPKLEDAERVAECDRLLEEIEREFGERCGELQIPLGDLTRGIRDLVSRVPTPAAPAPVQEASAGAPAPQAAAAGSPAPAISAPAEFSSRGDVDSLLMKVATYMKQSAAQDPLGYRLPRIVAFAPLNGEPPNDAGKLIIPGPEPSSLSAMRSLWSASDWLGLVETADNVCRSSPLALDAHRYCSEALAALGGPYQAAADGIRDEVKSLLKRAPRLVRLQFSDGTPLADPETQKWLEDAAAGPAASAAAASEVDPEELETARTEARELGRKGDLPAALARLDSTVAGDTSPRGRFLGRLELAELCVGTGHDRVALPMLAELDDTLQKHALESWEPALSRRLLELYYQCRKRGAAVKPDATGAPGAPGSVSALGAAEAAEAMARAERLYERLCRVDPIAAAALE